MFIFKNIRRRFQRNIIAKLIMLSIFMLVTIYFGSYINNSGKYLRNEIIIGMPFLIGLLWYILKESQMKNESNKIALIFINLSLIITIALFYLVMNEVIALGDFIYNAKSALALYRIIEILQAVIIISVLIIAVKSSVTKVKYFGTIMHLIGVYFTLVGYKNLRHAGWLPSLLATNPFSKNILIYIIAILLIVLYFVYEKITGVNEK